MGTASSTPFFDGPQPLLILGDASAPRGIVLRGAPYALAEHHGRGHAIGVGAASAAPAFMLDASGGGGFAVRLEADRALSLEVNFRKVTAGTALSLWYVTGHPEWACRFECSADGTLSPAGRADLVVAARDGTLELAARGARGALVFARGADIAAAVAAARGAAAAAAAAAAATAAAALTPAVRDDLRTKGFARLRGVVAPALVRAALREVNRQLGAGSPDAFRAKTFAASAVVNALFNDSALPAVCAALLGPLPAGAVYSQTGAQLALRFPGDLCARGDPDGAAEAADAVRRAWHIDGLPGPFLRGITDHYGEVRNFDALVGVLLADVDAPQSGELCVYPGSHVELARHVADASLLPRLCREGAAALPTGAATDSVLSRAPEPCLGRAGDVFIANYMCAHFVAPNGSPNIRYAVYFRVRGPAFEGSLHAPHAMLAPLADWPGLGGAPHAAMRLPRAQTLDAAQADAWRAFESGANNDHTAPRL
jgi:hypothetical protein